MLSNLNIVNNRKNSSKLTVEIFATPHCDDGDLADHIRSMSRHPSNSVEIHFETERVRKILNSSVDAERKCNPDDILPGDPTRNTALLFAVKQRKYHIIKLLLFYGAQVNKANALGITPLVLACQNEDLLCAEMLLKFGANPNVTIKSGDYPLMIAVRAENAALVELLLRYNATTTERPWRKKRRRLREAIRRLGHTSSESSSEEDTSRKDSRKLPPSHQPKRRRSQAEAKRDIPYARVRGQSISAQQEERGSSVSNGTDSGEDDEIEDSDERERRAQEGDEDPLAYALRNDLLEITRLLSEAKTAYQAKRTAIARTSLSNLVAITEPSREKANSQSSQSEAKSSPFPAILSRPPVPAAQYRKMTMCLGLANRKDQKQAEHSEPDASWEAGLLKKGEIKMTTLVIPAQLARQGKGAQELVKQELLLPLLMRDDRPQTASAFDPNLQPGKERFASTMNGDAKQSQARRDTLLAPGANRKRSSLATLKAALKSGKKDENNKRENESLSSYYKSHLLEKEGKWEKSLITGKWVPRSSQMDEAGTGGKQKRRDNVEAESAMLKQKGPENEKGLSGSISPGVISGYGNEGNDPGGDLEKNTDSDGEVSPNYGASVRGSITRGLSNRESVEGRLLARERRKMVSEGMGAVGGIISEKRESNAKAISAFLRESKSVRQESIYEAIIANQTQGQGHESRHVKAQVLSEDAEKDESKKEVSDAATSRQKEDGLRKVMTASNWIDLAKLSRMSIT